MINIIRDILESPLAFEISDAVNGRPKVKRHKDWPKIRRMWIDAGHDYCAVCGFRSSLNVHHIKPVHAFPDLELSLDNLITIGEACPTGNHHLWFGHLGDWRSWNVLVGDIANAMHNLWISRPYHTKEFCK